VPTALRLRAGANSSHDHCIRKGSGIQPASCPMGYGEGVGIVAGIRRSGCRLRLKCDGTCAKTRFRLSAKRKSPFKSAGTSVQSTTGSRGVRIGGSNAGYTMFRCSVKSTGYPLHSPVSSSLPLPCVTVCHHISTGLYNQIRVSI
jgi:hypothetical protein